MTNRNDKKIGDYEKDITADGIKKGIKTPSENITEFPKGLKNEEPTGAGTFENRSEGIEKPLTLVEEKQIEYYEEQKKTEKVKKACLTILGFLLILGGIFAGVLGVIWAYKINNIAEPMGAIKTDNEWLKKQDEELKIKIKDLEIKIDSIKDNFFIQK